MCISEILKSNWLCMSQLFNIYSGSPLNENMKSRILLLTALLSNGLFGCSDSDEASDEQPIEVPAEEQIELGKSKLGEAKLT